jgi:flagellar basal body P-ring formation protein FlgA
MIRLHRLSIVGMAARAAALCLALAGAGPVPAAAEELGVIPSRIIYPGETIAADSLAMARVRPGKPTTIAFARDPRDLVGKVAKRTLLPGRFVPLGSVRDAYLVAQGSSVQVMFVEGGLTISVTAVTLEPGSAGDVVKVRNTDSGAVFSATVMADGTARVGAS